MFPMDSAKLLCILQRKLSKLQNRNECEVINYPRLHQKEKKKKIAVNSSRNGLTIGNIQEWVPSSRKIMKDTGCPWSGQKVAMLGNPGFLWPHPATIKIGDFMLTQF